MDIELLLMEVDPENPCGENLEYDADFMEMEKASSGKIEQQFGDTIIPAEAPDWNSVVKLGEDLLSRTKDLRVMIYLTQGWTELDGLTGYLNGLQLINQAFEKYWVSIHPELEFDGEFDPLFRINTIARLSDQGGVISSFRSAMLFKDVSGEITMRDAYGLLDGSKQESPTYPGGKTRLINELSTKAANITEQFQKALQALESIIAKLQSNLDDMVLPDFSATLKMLNTFASINTGNLSENIAVSDAGNQVDGSAPLSTPVMTQKIIQNWRQMDIQSRDDAILMLDKVKAYFTQYEPSHPAPLMINRVQLLVKMDFMQIIENLAPEGVTQVKTIFGSNHDEY